MNYYMKQKDLEEIKLSTRGYVRVLIKNRNPVLKNTGFVIYLYVIFFY